MADNRFGCGCGQPSAGREGFCIETNRVYDSCRDRDCYENVRVSLTDCGNEIISRTGNIRAKDACIAWTYIGLDPVRFNRGFYTVNIRYYIKITFEACLGAARPQEFEGIAVVDKSVVLYGGESNINTFRSDPDEYGSCPVPDPAECDKRVPTAVVETVDPIILSAGVYEKVGGGCCCCACDLPREVISRLNGSISDREAEGGRYLAVSVGIFSVIRVVRPALLTVQASEYTVPDKECVVPPEENPCGIFRNMAFPVGEFSTSALRSTCERNKSNS